LRPLHRPDPTPQAQKRPLLQRRLPHRCHASEETWPATSHSTIDAGSQGPAKVGALAPLLPLVGLLAGIALAFGYERFMAGESPTVAFESQVVKLRKQSADPFEDQLNGHFWLRECNQHSPLCAGYISGFTRMNSILAHPFFCIGDLRVAEVESVVAKELRRLNRLSPVLLDYPMSALLMNALERWFPCNTMVG